MSDEDRQEIGAILDYLERMINTSPEPVPRAVKLVALGGYSMIRGILNKEPSPTCGPDYCELPG